MIWRIIGQHPECLGEVAARHQGEELRRNVPCCHHVTHSNLRKKPKGRPMPATARRATNVQSKVRSRVEHLFAEQEYPKVPSPSHPHWDAGPSRHPGKRIEAIHIRS